MASARMPKGIGLRGGIPTQTVGERVDKRDCTDSQTPTDRYFLDCADGSVDLVHRVVHVRGNAEAGAVFPAVDDADDPVG